MKPVPVLLLAYTAGILLGHGFLYFPYSIAVLCAVLFVVLFVRVRLNAVSLHRFMLVLLSALAGAAAYLFSVLWLPSDHYLKTVSLDRPVHSIEGRIASALDRDPDKTAFNLELSGMDGIKASGMLRVSIREASSAVGYGDRIAFSGKLFQPVGFRNPGGFDYPAYLARSGVFHTVSLKNEGQVKLLARGNGLFRKIQDWRELIRRAFLASTSGPGSAILQAMVLGEEGALTDELRDTFLAAGVTHIISISGSHLGMVAVVCFGLIRLIMRLLPENAYHRLTLFLDPKKTAALVTLPLVVFYTLLAGGQMATVRSLVMLTAALAALVLDRENALLHSLALAGLLILAVHPGALFDISFQLSFLSVVCIGFVVLLWNDIPFERKPGITALLRNAALLVVISFTAAIATGPLVVHYFNQFSAAGIVSNIFVVPFAGMLVVPLGLLSGILTLFLGHLPLAWPNQAAADWFIELVRFFSRLPFAEIRLPSPGIAAMAAYAVLVSSLFIAFRSWLLARFRPFEHAARSSRVMLFSAVPAAAVLILAAGGSFIKGQDRARVIFPDVGQGDSALVRVSGKNILIDGGGTHDNRFDVGGRVLAPFLWNEGVRCLDLVILSHPHPDHMNGLRFILSKFKVKEVWTHGKDTDLPGYDELVRTVRETGVRLTTVSAGDPPRGIGAAELSVLHPAGNFHSLGTRAYAAENDRSLVLQIAVRNKVLLFTGDIGEGVEQMLVRKGALPRCDLIKVPHHGSGSSSSEALLKAARPSIAVIPVGKGNWYRHPSREVLERYEAHRVRVFRTDRDAAIVAEIEDDAVRVACWNELELKRAARTGYARERELDNWKRLWIRMVKKFG